MSIFDYASIDASVTSHFITKFIESHPDIVSEKKSNSPGDHMSVHD